MGGSHLVYFLEHNPVRYRLVAELVWERVAQPGVHYALCHAREHLRVPVLDPHTQRFDDGFGGARHSGYFNTACALPPLRHE